MEEILGEVPMPGLAACHPLVMALFEIGPVMYDGYITWQELESWKKVTGTDLDPWEASTIVSLSRVFFRQREESKSISSLCPWPKGRNIWKYVQDEKQKKSLEEERAILKARKEKEPDGTRKRHRNPPPG